MCPPSTAAPHRGQVSKDLNCRQLDPDCHQLDLNCRLLDLKRRPDLGRCTSPRVRPLREIEERNLSVKGHHVARRLRQKRRWEIDRILDSLSQETFPDMCMIIKVCLGNRLVCSAGICFPGFQYQSKALSMLFSMVPPLPKLYTILVLQSIGLAMVAADMDKDPGAPGIKVPGQGQQMCLLSPTERCVPKRHG
uniref:Uncharacterized protein n=1 Tax=Eutreptiella gymnastica TaxID=73025 RepID=A0A7S1N326_9EUGL